MPDPNEPVVLTVAPNEAHAALLVAALDAHGVEAQLIGGLTSGFRAEAPGGVRILVRQTDLPRAQAALDEIAASRDTGADADSDEDADRD